MIRFARLVLGVLVVLMAARPAAAQGRKPSYGIQGGINFAKFGGADVGDVDTRTGFQAGGFVTFPVGRYVAIQPSVSYSQEGTKVDAGAGVTGTFKLDYIEVPLLLRLSAPLQGSGQLRPYVAAGPAVAFQVSCRIKASQGSQSVEDDCSDPAAGFDTKSFQFGLHFGAGIEIGRLALGLRYQLGLTSIDDTGADADVKNRVLAVVAGFRIGGPR